MASLELLVIHCAATPPSLKLTPDHIRQWHLVDNGWSRVGYSDLITRDGKLHNLTPFNQDNEVDYDEMTWGVKGQNKRARHICLEGGIESGKPKSPLDQFPKMESALFTYIDYTILRHPKIKIAGHYHFDKKKANCPGFNVEDWLVDNGFENVWCG